MNKPRQNRAFGLESDFGHFLKSVYWIPYESMSLRTNVWKLKIRVY